MVGNILEGLCDLRGIIGLARGEKSNGIFGIRGGKLAWMATSGFGNCWPMFRANSRDSTEGITSSGSNLGSSMSFVKEKEDMINLRRRERFHVNRR